MAGTDLAPGANLVNDEWFNFGRGNVGGGTGRIRWNPGDIKDPFTFGKGAMSPAEAQAAIANALANPIAPVPFSIQGPRYRNGYHIGDVRIEDQQEQKPENPGRRYASASTWGRTIPVSMGKRRLEGNLLSSTPLVPKLEGTVEYEITYEIPIYEDPPLKPGGAITVTYPGDDRPRPSPGSESGCGGGSPCDTRSSPDVPEDPTASYTLSVLIQDPNPGGPYLMNITIGSTTGTTGIVSGTCPADDECQMHIPLLGSGPWTVEVTCTSSNVPLPVVELTFEASTGFGSNVSESGVSDPYNRTLIIDSDGNVT